MNRKDGDMLPTDLSPKAQQIINRLSAIDYENPHICEQQIRDAFSRHLIALNLHDRFVEIYRSFYAAFDAAWEDTYDATWDAAFEAAQKAVSDAAWETASKAARDAVNHFMSEAAMEAARKAAFDVASDAACDAPHVGAVQAAWEAAFKTAQEAACDAALRAVNKTASDPLWNVAWNDGFDRAFSQAWHDAKEAVKEVANGPVPRTGWDDAWNAAFRSAWKSWTDCDYARDRAFKAASDAADFNLDFATWCAARGSARKAASIAVCDGVLGEAVSAVECAVVCVNSTISSPQHEQLCAVWMPFVDAIEAGLFDFLVTPTKVIALTLPVMGIEENRLHQLHADGQPAVQWSDWERYYFWHGTEIPQKYGAVLSQNWRSQWLLEEPNAEFRRVLIQGIGYDRIVQDLEAIELDAWREYSLLKIQADIDLEPIHLLKMTCPSTNHIHVLRVPPHLTSAREAIRWVNWDVDSETFVAET
ncbi:DUF6745 domain-containing protein [Microcoleus sp. FACHB-672]|uniref:DUF6745 domain-containing protein n=1 Tax=Microcoleus sp. FACHB-672 TaxID=2692825 RepID=UPI001689C1D3|nr:hypothetical protein [Microcoleus sp. FACHB-672]MBD2043455.1 hypothetical protein [Microcoleus sp. FACHB-672]